MRRLLELACLALAACATAPPAPRLEELVGEPPPFRALYRFQCCGWRGLLLVVAHGASGTLVEVAGGPSGVGLAAWVEGERVTRRTELGCLESGQPGVLPVASGWALPVSEAVLSSLLSGRLPASAREVAPGRWAAPIPGGALELALVGGPTRWVQGWLRVEDQPQAMRLEARRHHGRVPGEIRIRAPGFDAMLDLVEFQPAEDVPSPAWLSLPRCGAP